MSNSKKIASIAFTGAAMTPATMMAAAPTLAQSAFTIKAARARAIPPVAAKGNLVATATLKDTTEHNTLTRKKGHMPGTMSAAAGNAPQKAGTINTATWSSRTGPFSLQIEAHLTIRANITATGGAGGRARVRACGKLTRAARRPAGQGKERLAQAGSGFGHLLRQYRLAAGLTQEKLAERAGAGVHTIADLERRRTTRPYPSTVQKLADALGLNESQRELLTRASRPAPGLAACPRRRR